MPALEARRGAGQGRGRRRQPAGRDAAPGQLSAAARRAGHSGARDCRRGGRARRGRDSAGRSATRSRALVAGRRLCRILPSCTRPSRCRSSRSSPWSRPRAIPETFFTVWHNVFERGALKSGETMLLHGGSSGIGTTAIMLAKAAAARASSSRSGRRKRPKPAASSAPILRSTTRRRTSSPRPSRSTDGKGAEVIIDMVAGDYIQNNYEAAAMDGRIVQIAFQRPPKAMVDFRPILMKRLWHTGSACVRARSPTRPRSRKRGRRERLAADRGRQGKAGDLQDLPAARGRGCACADGDERAHRQDRAHRLTLRAPFRNPARPRHG